MSTVALSPRGSSVILPLPAVPVFPITVPISHSSQGRSTPLLSFPLPCALATASPPIRATNASATPRIKNHFLILLTSLLSRLDTFEQESSKFQFHYMTLSPPRYASII